MEYCVNCGLKIPADEEADCRIGQSCDTCSGIVCGECGERGCHFVTNDGNGYCPACVEQHIKFSVAARRLLKELP